MRLLPLHRVRFASGPFAQARDVDLAYALSLEPDRLLAPFRREAGLPERAPSYGNWEDSGLDGHIAGHYLSALALLGAATGEPEPRERLTRMVAELAEIQQANGGYVGGVPGGRALFESLADRPDAIASFASSEYWVPWYNLHKTFQGLIDAHVVGGSADALEIVVRLGEWWLPIAACIDDETFERMLDIEYGGMNDAFARLALLTGRSDFAEAAERFSHRAILDPLLRGEDRLTGLHANTQIPKAIGYATTALATADDAYLRAADVFWRTVVDHRTVVIGGNSVREHFHSPHDFGAMIEEREGPEFCNTSNMLQLTRLLAERRLEPAHLDYAERALFNHVLGSQHPRLGGFVYFTPMRPRHYRVYSQPQEGFWCCVGTGLEAQARSAEWVFGIEGDAFAVNLFAPAEAEVPEFGGRIRVDADLPVSPDVTVSLDLESARGFPLRIRVPAWADALHDLRVNGEPVAPASVPGAILITREWTDGDRVTFRLPLEVRAERMPDGSAWQAFLLGPSVLAARAGTEGLDGLRADDSRMGHIAHGPLLPLAELPILAPGADDLDSAGIALEPFAGIHDERYTLYWPVADHTSAERHAELAALDERLAVDGMTIDAVALGEQQPESDHAFRGTETDVVVDDGIRWRTTHETVSVRMSTIWAGQLRVRYAATTDATAVAVRVDDVLVAQERFAAGDGVHDREYALAELLPDLGYPASVRVSFAATDGCATPRLGAVRITR